MKKPTYTWDEKTKIATCTIWDKDNKPHTGTAICHQDDYDMGNERTGCAIAEMKAVINSYKAYKYKLKNELGALKQLYYSMKHSLKFNPKSYENKMLFRQIKLRENDIDVVEKMIIAEKANLRLYIKDKDHFYKQVRKNRNANKK